MSDNFKTRQENLLKKIELEKTNKAKAEQRLETLTEKLKDLNNKLQEFGLTIDTASTRLSELKSLIESKLQKAEDLIK